MCGSFDFHLEDFVAGENECSADAPLEKDHVLFLGALAKHETGQWYEERRHEDAEQIFEVLVGELELLIDHVSYGWHLVDVSGVCIHHSFH